MRKSSDDLNTNLDASLPYALLQNIVRGITPLLVLLYSTSTLIIITMAYFMIKDPEQIPYTGMFHIIQGLSTIFFFSVTMEDTYEAVRSLKDAMR